jgi:LPS export ABC transporter protein LptC
MIRSKFFWILSAILIITIIGIIGYRENKVKISPSYKTSSMLDLHLTHKEGDAIKWQLYAKEAIFPLGEKEVLLKSLGVNINHSPKIYLTSGSGKYELEKGDITLDSPVELNVKNGKFITSSLKWNNNDEVISTDDDVRFTGKNFFITGTGLTAKLNQERVRILRNVKAIYYR